MIPPEEPFTVPEGTLPVVLEVDEIRLTAGWVSGLEYIPDLLEELASTLRTMNAEAREVRGAGVEH